MTKVVHPYAQRLGILRDWKSRWFASGPKYAENLRADILIREWLEKRLRGSYVSSIEIERSRKFVRIMIKTSRPGMIIGRQGDTAQKLRKDLFKFMKKKNIKIAEEVKIDILEVASPDSDAAVIAYGIVEALEKRMPFRRAMKMTKEKVMAVRGVKGVRIVVTGRLNGAEMARREEVKEGSIPLQTFRADVDYAMERANLPYGVLGVKVWINRGLVFEDKK
jgi:small subunit ribosomal protein S3